MKKIISILLSVLAVGMLFAGCQNNKNAEAMIDYRQAGRLIESYPIEELGLTEEQVEGAKYLTYNNPVELDGEKYFKVGIEKVNISDDGEHASFDIVALFLVTTDGKKAFIFNEETGELTKLSKKELPTLSQAEIDMFKETTTVHEHTHADEVPTVHEHTHADEVPTVHEHTHADETTTAHEHTHAE